MASKLDLLSVFVSILLCGNFCEAAFWNPIRSTIIDRTLPASNGTKSTDFHMLPVDRTTFIISKELWLHQIDLAKIFISNGNKTTNITDNVSVKAKIVQMSKNDRTLIATVYAGDVNLNSMDETKIVFKNDILLQRENLYEIRLFMPALNFVYSENLSVANYKIRRAFWRSIVLSFFPSNVIDTTANGAEINEKNISVGLVKRLHVKYTKF